MTKEQEKLSAQKKFKKLENFLHSSLGGQKRKLKIIKEVDKETPRGGEKEGNFIKFFLGPVLIKYFNTYPSVKVIIEGMNSGGGTQLKSEFFGSMPAFDFSFKSEANLFAVSPFLLDTVGEVKYGKLTFRPFATGLGQIIGYLQASKLGESPKTYGYYIFFNTDIAKSITEKDKEFLEELWERENVFVVII